MNVSSEHLRLALPLAESLLPKGWLEKQKSRTPNDLLLTTSLRLFSPKQIDQILREGFHPRDQMHPMAEAVLGAQRVLEFEARTGNFLCDLFAYRLLALAEVAKNIKKIQRGKERLDRLLDEQWRPALYELLVACSQSTVGAVEMIAETVDPTPDMKLANSIYLECKARSEYEGNVRDFITRVQRLALDRIFSECRNIGDGLQIEIDVHNHSGIIEIPAMLRAMFSEKGTKKISAYITIKVVPYHPGPHRLPRPMKAFSSELWRWLMGFENWRDWHLVQPYGEFEIENYSNMITSVVKRPVLVCIRSIPLSKSVPNISTTVKKACGQLKNHQPGIVRMLVRSDLYGIGQNAAPHKIKADLDAIAHDLLRQYSRLDGVRFDIVTPPLPGEMHGEYTFSAAARANSAAEIMTYAPGVFLI